jgi:formamidopyrimidine-DNA glycosylase
MIKVLKGFREVLNNSTYLAELKEQNGLLRQEIETVKLKQKTDKEAKYRERQMAFLRPQYEMKDYVRADGTRGNYLEKFASVFRREGQECPRCGSEILKTRTAGRGTHYCKGCQK